MTVSAGFCRMAVVDDRSEDRELITSLVRSCAESLEPPIHPEIRPFSSAEAFLFSYEVAPDYDILFLDIELPGLNGVELAKRIRAKNETVQIVFVTGYSDYIAEGYDVSALHYLMKPLEKEKLQKVLEKAVSRLTKNEKTLMVKTESRLIRIPVHEIRYIDVFGNYITIHAKENISEKKTLSSIEKELDERFYRLGRSAIINLTMVHHVTRSEVFLLSGETIPLPRGAYEGLIQAIIRKL